MKITALVEDTMGCCPNEHGLSFYVETEKHKLLVDSGASDLFAHNAEALGIDLSRVDTFILSHGHYDHAGGLMAFAGIAPDAKIYLKSSVFGEYYHVFPDHEKYIGVDKRIAELPQIVRVDGDLGIDDELFLFSGFKEKRCPAWSSSALMKKIGNGFIPDEFAHEQCLVITQGNRHILMSGCAHNGILSILECYREIFGNCPDIVISGFHMMKNGDHTAEETEYIRQTARELIKTNARFFTGHCTGQAAFEIMKEVMGDRLTAIHSGCVLL